MLKKLSFDTFLVSVCFIYAEKWDVYLLGSLFLHWSIILKIIIIDKKWHYGLYGPKGRSRKMAKLICYQLLVPVQMDGPSSDRICKQKRKFQIQSPNLKIMQELSMTQYRACSFLNLKDIACQDSVPMASNQSIK